MAGWPGIGNTVVVVVVFIYIVFNTFKEYNYYFVWNCIQINMGYIYIYICILREIRQC
jgi:hypothetical protein